MSVLAHECVGEEYALVHSYLWSPELMLDSSMARHLTF